MIYVSFIIDYLVMSLLPIDSYFIVTDIEKNNLFSILIIGFFLDIIYHKLLLNVFILLFLYFLIKKIDFKKKYSFFKNILIFIIYFNLLYLLSMNSFNNYFSSFIGSFILQIIYIFIKSKLLKE